LRSCWYGFMPFSKSRYAKFVLILRHGARATSIKPAWRSTTFVADSWSASELDIELRDECSDTDDRVLEASLLSLSLIASAAAFAGPGASRSAPMQRAASPAMQFNFQGKNKGEALPKGWKKVKSQSRPGEFSYLNMKTGQRFDKLPRSAGGDFYDDEKDSFASRLAFWNADEDAALSSVERSGFSESGKDLATDGLLLYAFFIPFLIAFFGYTSGVFSFGYKTGNF